MCMDSPFTLRRPSSTDGPAVHQLIAACEPLDTNSLYCNLLHCTHFSETSVAAFDQDELIGFISAYLIPAREDTLFIWQIAVNKVYRGQGLAKRMLIDILKRPMCQNITWLETTVTPSNTNSTQFFKRMARRLDAELSVSDLFDSQKHFNGDHESEKLFRIGPFTESNYIEIF